MKARAVDINFLPAWVFYVPDIQAWRRLRKKYRLDVSVPFPKHDASTTLIERVRVPGGARPNFVLLTVHPRTRRLPMHKVAELITHECMHTWRFIRQGMQESEPSLEFEAYAMQYLTQNVLWHHIDCHKRPWKSK